VNALLVYPEFRDTYWSFKHALKFICKRASLPPLGLLTIAAMMPPSWKRRLVDMNVRRLRDSDLAWADTIFIGAMIAQSASTRAIIERCHAAGKIIVAGGPLFTGCHEEFPLVDHFVLNEAELNFPAFIEDLEARRAKRVYETGAFADLHTTPMPAWDLASLKHYGSMCLQYSRGCPFDCEFCDVTAKFGRRARTKTVEQVLRELDALMLQGWRGSVFFVDDNLIGNKRALKAELLPALIAWQKARRIKVPFYTEASINLADDPELMELMSAAGFDTVFIGIETPDPQALRECNKWQNQGRDLIADIKRIQRAGLQVQGGFIVGFDSDLPSIFKRQISFIQESGIVTAMVGLLNALPGTKLHARLGREGRLKGTSSGDNGDGSLNFLPRMPSRQLVEGYCEVLKGIYSPRPYYQRIRTFLREYKAPRITAPFDWRRYHAFVLSWVRLGIVGRERLEYWRLLLWTLTRRPAMIQIAVTLAIYGHHFRRSYERMIRPLAKPDKQPPCSGLQKSC